MLCLGAVALLQAVDSTRVLQGDGVLRKALRSTARPLVAHVWDPQPSALPSWAVADVSQTCRTAGASAILVPPSLVSAVAEEQQAHIGDFPGPLPVLADCMLHALLDNEVEMTTLRRDGAAGIGVRYHVREWGEADELERRLRQTVEAAHELGLGAVLLGEREEAAEWDEVAWRVGAVGAVVGAPRTMGGEEEGVVAIGCWDGSDEELQRLRASGFGALLLEDACGGEVERGAPRCNALVRAARSKTSRTWSGSMFGATSGDVIPPNQRNPRLWAQSQRQAREIMHESAASRGLPPPKLKK